MNSMIVILKLLKLLWKN